MSKTFEEAAAEAMTATAEPATAQERTAPAGGFTHAARVITGSTHGQTWFRSNDSTVNRNSVVVASITELGFDSSGAFPMRGFARMQVSNVVPGPGFVDFWLNIDWASNLSFRINYQVS